MFKLTLSMRTYCCEVPKSAGQSKRAHRHHTARASLGCRITVGQRRSAVPHADPTFGVIVPSVCCEAALGVPKLFTAQRTGERHLYQHSRPTPVRVRHLLQRSVIKRVDLLIGDGV